MVDINKLVSEGWVHCRVIIEVMGKPEKYIEEGMRTYIDQLKKDEEIEIVDTEYSEVTPIESLFTGMVEVEMVIKSTEKLVWLCFDYLPSSVEIIAPDIVKYSARDFTHFLNELQNRIHAVSNEIKVVKQQNKVLEKNAYNLMINIIFYKLKEGKKPLSELAKQVGASEGQLKPFLEKLKEDGKVKEEDGLFELTR